MSSPTGVPAGRRGPRPIYFFLSYAHSAPMLRDSRNADPWVSKIFGDLCAAVTARARPSPGIRPGFIDQDVAVGDDWDARLAEALGVAEVFVPLYSPSYVNNSWPLRELAAFRERVKNAGQAQAGEHIVPILWVPFPGRETPGPEVISAALALADGLPEYAENSLQPIATEYAENGLRAMAMLGRYRPQYVALVERLAERIVELAERSPLSPSSAPSVESMPATAVKPAFAVAVLATTRSAARSGSDPGVYGDSSQEWRPFAGQQVLPAAAYVASIAERLGLPTVMTDYAGAADLFASCPAVLLIDPWVLAQPDGETQLRELAKRLPPWVMPLLVVDEAARESARGSQFVDEAVAMLIRGGVPEPQRVNLVPEFVDIMPSLITEARRQYLRHGRVAAPIGQPRPRMRLRDPETPQPRQPGMTDG